jgi:hypothetical protein
MFRSPGERSEKWPNVLKFDYFESDLARDVNIEKMDFPMHSNKFTCHCGNSVLKGVGVKNCYALRGVYCTSIVYLAMFLFRY